MGVWYKADGKIEGVEPVAGGAYTGAELNKFVGGYFEVLPIRRGRHRGKVLICNEDGKAKKLGVNSKATQLFNGITFMCPHCREVHCGQKVSDKQLIADLTSVGLTPILGDVLICRPEEVT
jgi:hypothetical protein